MNDMKKEISLPILQENAIYQTITGSTAYGLSSEQSDVDQKAIVILPPVYNIKLTKEWETTTFNNPDIEFHSLKKAMNLYLSQNPTMLETLFVEDPYIVKITKFGDILRKNRKLFLTKNCFNTFGGYAKAQLMRIKKNLYLTTHEDDLNYVHDKIAETINKINRSKPDQSSVALNKLFFDKKDNLTANISIHINDISLKELNQISSELTNQLKTVTNNKNSENFTENKLWKHGMHLVRLLKMGIEILEEESLTVYRKEDRDLLLSIRNGQISWEEIFKMTDDLFKELKKAHKNTTLPEQIDEEIINNIYFELMKDYYGVN
jgi:uncharacterized protein